jgi:metal-responsive CopG/Arc/MetJ family transcriptional regulator
MGARAVQISIDEKLLRALDADPETRKRGRSAVVRSALVRYLAEKRSRKIDDAIRAAYATCPDENDDLDAFIAGQAWPER